MRSIEISARKLHLSAVIVGLKVQFFKSFLKVKVLDFIIHLSISMTISLLNIDGCIMKWSISNQFWTYIFLFLSNSIQRSFFIVSENDVMQRTLEEIYIIYQEYELKRVPYKRELIDLYVFQKSPHSMLLF